MSRVPQLRVTLLFATMVWAIPTGCIHNHYYGTTPVLPGCPPTISSVTTQVGSVCDVPNGQMVVSSPSTKAIVSNVSEPTNREMNSGISRVVISQPAYGAPSVGQSVSRFRWHKPDPETLPIMKAEGTYEEPIIR